MKNKANSDYAQCYNCGWDYDCFYEKSPSYWCQKHANQTGHIVSREIGRQVTYHPKP